MRCVVLKWFELERVGPEFEYGSPYRIETRVTLDAEPDRIWRAIVIAYAHAVRSDQFPGGGDAVLVDGVEDGEPGIAVADDSAQGSGPHHAPLVRPRDADIDRVFVEVGADCDHDLVGHAAQLLRCP